MRRYGFHGLSYEYIASVLPEHDARAAAGKTVVCHLGNGSSMCAIEAGGEHRQHDGIHRARRAADGHALRRHRSRRAALPDGRAQMDARAIEKLLYKKSGLLGVSGISSDMRKLLDSNDPRAQLAVDLFVYRIGRELGSLAAALGGLDALVFTAGIGENSAAIRERVCRDAGVARRRRSTPRPIAAAAAHQHAGEPGLGVGHPDQRGADDRAPHTAARREWHPPPAHQLRRGVRQRTTE